MPSDIAIKVRRGTGTQWIAANPILAAGELGLNTDINRLKVGNGTLAWNSLSYINIAPTDVNEATQDYIGAFLQNGAHDGVSVTYNDTLNTIAISANRDVVVDKTTVQTLTNKTLTSPVINTPTGITKSDVGLGNVDNTTDAAKPISTATQTALDLKLASTTAASTYATITNNNLKAPIESPTFTGTVTLPGAPSLDLHAATKGYVDSSITNIVDGAPSLLNTLNELAAAINDDANYTTTLTTALSNKQDKVANVDDTEIGYLNGVTSSIQTQLDGKVDESIITAKGDLYVGSASSALDNLPVGTNGYLLTADSSETLGVKWAAAPVSLPQQTDQQGKYLTTDGTSASWAVVDLTPVNNNLIMQIMEAY